MTERAHLTCEECGRQFWSVIMPWDDDEPESVEAECPDCGQFQDCEVEA